jgi:hypothetical protein
VRFLSSAPTLEQNPGTSSREADVNSVPVINKDGLAEDWLIWSTVSCLALYIVSGRRRSVLRHQVLDSRPSARTTTGVAASSWTASDGARARHQNPGCRLARG